MLAIWRGLGMRWGGLRAYGVCNGLNASVTWGGDAAGPLDLRLLCSGALSSVVGGPEIPPRRWGMMGRARSWQLHTLRVACVRTPGSCKFQLRQFIHHEVAAVLFSIGDCRRGEREEFHWRQAAGRARGAGRAREVQRVP